jgi:hypothetical protein
MCIPDTCQYILQALLIYLTIALSTNRRVSIVPTWESGWWHEDSTERHLEDGV